MSDIAGRHRAIVDAIASLSADITEAHGDATIDQLRSVMASALWTQLQGQPSIDALAPTLTRLHQVVPDNARADLLHDLDAIGSAGVLPSEALAIARDDPREMLLSGRLVNQLSGLAPAERLGPFATLGGIDIWFNAFIPAHRKEVRETGATAPALVFTRARPPVTRASTTTIAIEAGTVWIRGDLVDGSLPAATFTGIKVASGSLRLNQNITINGDVVEIAAPLKGVLELKPAPDDVTPVAGACQSADAKVTLPNSLTFTFDAGSSTAKGTAGKAEVWGQTFNFAQSTGAWVFIERLWTVVLGYQVNPLQFDADPIDDDLVHFEGVGAVSSAGLGLPVVVATNPAILGEVAHAAGWFLLVQGLLGRWYQPDARLHTLQNAWIGISAFGATLVAIDVAPLNPPVTHTYDLWTISGGSDKRLPWRQTYEAQFSLSYSCHVVEGELFMIQGRADVALDRPVTTNGVPIPTPTTQGTVLLQQFAGAVTAMLGAPIANGKATHQFALRNALVWTGEPAFIIARGNLLSPQQIDAGSAQLLFGVYGWAPTLPDPYVSNAFIRFPKLARGAPHALLIGRVVWSTPDNVTVSFAGQLGTNITLDSRDTSPGNPRPARKSHDAPYVGSLQVDQDQLTLDRELAAEWRKAQSAEKEGRDRRAFIAQEANAKSLATLGGYITEIVGSAPNVLLLDVSTNQDLLGVAIGARPTHDVDPALSSGYFPVADLAVHSPVLAMRVVALPQVQWEPVRTLDADQDIMTMGWFPTPLASATDGGATQIGARSQKLMPVIPEDALQGTLDAYQDGTPVGVLTTFPFGLVGAIHLQPKDTPQRKADLYGLTRPTFPDEQSLGGIQITAHAEGGRPDNGGISPMFQGQMRQLLNGVDLPSGLPLGLSVLGETLQPLASVEKIFNDDMTSRPRVPVTRIDLSGYGGSNFSDWNDPLAAFAAAAKVQFRLMIGRTALEVIKVNSVLHPWGVRVTRSITIERRPGGGVIRRDSGWQAFTPGMFDYRYTDDAHNIVVAPYTFDAGVFRGLFNVRSIRPAPGAVFNHGGTTTLVPYYFDADVALEGVPGRTAAMGILGYLQTRPNGVPAGADALQSLIETQGPIGGPLNTWMPFGGSGMLFRAQRIEVGLAINGGTPLFVATVRGVPKLPETGAWSMVVRPVANIPPDGGEAVTVAENRGVPLIRRYPVAYSPGDNTVFTEPPLSGTPGDHRFADAADLLTQTAPANDYALLQSTPTHAFLFPRPFVPSPNAPRIESGYKPALADIIARSTSKGAFPPAGNTIEMTAGAFHFDVGSAGKLALSAPISIVGYPTPLRIAGTQGHGSNLYYDTATLSLQLDEDRWEAEFTGLRIWSDISGLEHISGAELRVVGSTDQRPQIAEIKSLLLDDIETMLQYIPIVGARGVQGPIDLGATNAKHEFKIDAQVSVTVPPTDKVFPLNKKPPITLKLFIKQGAGFDKATGSVQSAATFGAELDGKIGTVYILVVTGQITFSLTSMSGSVTEEKLSLLAFVGVGVMGMIGPFSAYAFLGVGFVLEYDAVKHLTKYGGLVALEAGVDLVIVTAKIRAELKGLVYHDAGATKCDYTGSVKIEVDIFLIFSISASYEVSDTSSF